MFHFVLQSLKFLHQNADCKPAQKTKIRKKLLFPDPNDLRKQGISISSTVTPMPRKNGGTFFFFSLGTFFCFQFLYKKATKQNWSFQPIFVQLSTLHVDNVFPALFQQVRDLVEIFGEIFKQHVSKLFVVHFLG